MSAAKFEEKSTSILSDLSSGPCESLIIAFVCIQQVGQQQRGAVALQLQGSHHGSHGVAGFRLPPVIKLLSGAHSHKYRCY